MSNTVVMSLLGLVFCMTAAWLYRALGRVTGRVAVVMLLPIKRCGGAWAND